MYVAINWSRDHNIIIKLSYGPLKVNKSYVKVFINNYNKEYYINSLLKDKKNTNNDSINCILPFDLGNIKKVNINKSYFYENIDEIIKEIYANTI